MGNYVLRNNYFSSSIVDNMGLKNSYQYLKLENCLSVNHEKTTRPSGIIFCIEMADISG